MHIGMYCGGNEDQGFEDKKKLDIYPEFWRNKS